MKKKSYYTKYSVLYYAMETARWIMVIAPFIFLLVKNKTKYFVNVEGSNNGTKMTIGAIILVGVLAFVIKREIDKKKGRSHAPSVINGIIGWGIAYALVFCFNTIIQDLLLVVRCGLIGQCLGFIFEMLAQSIYEKKKLYLSAEINAKTMVMAQKESKGGIVPYE